MRGIFAWTLAVALELMSAAAGAETSAPTLTVADLVSVKGIGDRDGVAISPDGRWVAYQMERIELEANQKFTDVYLIETQGNSAPRQLTHNAAGRSEAKSPRWSPDSKTLAYFADNGGESGIWVTHLPDLKSEPLKLNLSVVAGNSGNRAGNMPAELKWSPDSRMLAFTVDRESKAPLPEIRQGLRFDLGWKGSTPMGTASAASLCTVELSSGAVECLTPEGLNVLDFAWSPDVRHMVLVATNDVSYTSYMSADLYILDRQSRQVEPLVVQPGRERTPVWSPDGRWIAFTSQNGSVDWLQKAWPAIVSAEGGKPKFLGDQWRQMSNASTENLRWSRDSRSLYFSGKHRFGVHLFTMDVRTGTPVRLTPDTSSVYRAISMTPDEKKVAYVLESPIQAPELYVADLKPFKQRRLLQPNAQLENFPKPTLQMLEWPSSDGAWKVQGALIRPPGFQTGIRYPMLLWVQGGPGMASLQFNFTDQYPNLIFAARGYLILAVNTRGREGYGKGFHEAIGTERSYGDNPTQDLMDGIDMLVRAGVADPERLGIMGLSYGGYLSAFAPTRTTRFKAASAGDPLLDMVRGGFDTGLDPGGRILRSQMHGLGDVYLPEELQRSQSQSPLYQVDKIKTPINLECGIESQLMVQCRAFYHALQFHSVPSVLIGYPRTGHGIVEPALIADSYRRNLAWFDYWLLGKGGNPVTQK